MPFSDMLAPGPLEERDARPTRVRYVLLGVAMANAFLLYLDRICMGAVVQSGSFQTELGLGKDRVGDALAAFFLAYALGQLPAGWLVDRFGPRRMLVIYILLWSCCTALTGVATGLAMLVGMRLACGLSEAGAYPASARIIKRWFPFAQRARASSAITFGGRFGGAIAIWLTAAMIVGLGSWRPVLWIYGTIGTFLAAVTWFVFRADPASHPWTNAAERNYISAGDPPPAAQAAYRFPWRELLTHRGLWMLNLASFGANFGWAYIVTWLQGYLTEVRGLDSVTAGRYVSMALIGGMAGILFGGWWCDALTRWFGPKWGRRLPLIVGSAISATAYLMCPSLGSAGAVAVAAGVVAFAADSLNPAVWALAQDIGGNHVAATLAWSNMWGNLGASAISKLIPMVLASSFHWADRREIFWICASGFVVLCISAFFVDSTQRLPDPDAALRE
jgi:sugar phosphate permease